MKKDWEFGITGAREAVGRLEVFCPRLSAMTGCNSPGELHPVSAPALLPCSDEND